MSEKTGKKLSINKTVPLSGGSINDAYLLETTAGKFFMKYNRASIYPGMFEQEARGLALLHNAGVIRIPQVVDHGDTGTHTFIILEYLDSAGRKHDFWEDFGRNLAALHRHTADQFGLDHDNYIGSLKQYNDQYVRWIDFFREQRLQVQIELAIESGLLPSQIKQAFEQLFKRLEDIFPEEPPSLIHGDLWSGNYMVDEKGEACIIDPAVYYGFREMDIGMSRLFGVFGSEFYDAYNEAWPMEPGWRERVEICNLYPLMVHVNLFGTGYLGSVESILSRF
ncbi:MAG: fructosamine kinase family protein [Bacteroidales bacterium]|nr:fructosamine kinase family protein [Bacteroidales bacterium]